MGVRREGWRDAHAPGRGRGVLRFASSRREEDMKSSRPQRARSREMEVLQALANGPGQRCR